VSKKHDVEKARHWQAVIRDAARSGMSTRAFCRLRKLKASQFYWWQRRLKEKRNSSGTPVDFAGQISPNRLLYGG